MHMPSTVIVPRNIWVKIGPVELSVVTPAGAPPAASMKTTPDPVYLRKSQNDEAEWFSEDKNSYTIRFKDKSPFQSKEFVVPP